jgi:hypothetical protein
MIPGVVVRLGQAAKRRIASQPNRRLRSPPRDRVRHPERERCMDECDIEWQAKGQTAYDRRPD